MEMTRDACEDSISRRARSKLGRYKGHFMNKKQ
jgi:hypothetical protein